MTDTEAAVLPDWELDETVGERYLTAYGPFHVALLHEARFKLLEKNARFMRNETFRRLVDNVSKDGALAGAVFAWREAGDPQHLVTLSGNHRIQTAREAGVALILVVYTEADLTRDDQVAIQLSHNALVGEDDPVILKSLWDEIGTIDAKTYAGLDDRTLGELEKIAVGTFQGVNLDYRTVTFVFLPAELDRAREAFAAAKDAVDLKAGGLARLADYDHLLDELARTQASYDVKNTALGLMLMLDVFDRHRADLAEGWWDTEMDQPRHEAWVPLASILGRDTIPPASAGVIRKAVERMVGRGDVPVKQAWIALEMLAADYLAAGPDA